MRAVICRAWGAVDEKLEDVPVPVPADDEVLIEVRATSVN
jgi:NADPH:quinone reductase-like Zn-dependent oxidoreductase